MKKVLSLKEKALLGNGCLGLVWIVNGFLQIFKPTIFLNIISIIFLLIGIAALLIAFFVKSEQDDEMSKYNKNKARSSTYGILALLISVFTLMVLLKGTWIIDLKMIMPFLLGGINLIEFIFFVFYEKVGA